MVVDEGGREEDVDLLEEVEEEEEVVVEDEDVMEEDVDFEVGVEMVVEVVEECIDVLLVVGGSEEAVVVLGSIGDEPVPGWPGVTTEVNVVIEVTVVRTTESVLGLVSPFPLSPTLPPFAPCCPLATCCPFAPAVPVMKMLAFALAADSCQTNLPACLLYKVEGSSSSSWKLSSQNVSGISLVADSFSKTTATTWGAGLRQCMTVVLVRALPTRRPTTRSITIFHPLVLVGLSSLSFAGADAEAVWSLVS